MKDCIFCKIGRHEARSWMVAESEHAFAILKYSSNEQMAYNGHSKEPL